MRYSNLTAIVSLSSMLFVAAAPQAFAYAGRQSTQAAQPPNASTLYTTEEQVKLSPVVVHGHHLPLPLALQMVKKGLKRPWSGKVADLDKLVCRFKTMTGSHLQTLSCMTNRMHFQRQDKTQSSLDTAYGMHHNVNSPNNFFVNGISKGLISLVVSNWTNSHVINPGGLRHILKKLPAADASYNLVVKDHGKPVMAYVVNNGELVKVIRFRQDGTDKQ